MRVLMLSKALVVGIYQRKLEWIAKQGVELLAVTPPSWKDERGDVLLERAYTDGYRLETLPIQRNGDFHLHYYSGLGKLMREFKPQIVHIDEEPYNLATWQALWHARRVGAKALFFSWQNIERRYPPPFRWGEGWVLRSAYAAIAGTDSAAEVLRSKGYTREIAVIAQFGVDPELFCPPEWTLERPFTIGCVARLVPEKGLTVLLDACAKLEGEWRLRIVGGGPQREALEAQANELGIGERVTFLSQIPSSEMPEQYRAMDVLVAPSLTLPNWKEQFGPRAAVEAMSSGVAVIGSNSGAIPGVVADAGLIVPEGDAYALSAALYLLRTDARLCRELGERGRARVLAHYTHERIAAATVDVYRGLASG